MRVILSEDDLVRGMCDGSLSVAGNFTRADARAQARVMLAGEDLLAACKAKLAAFVGKEYDPAAFDLAADLCRKAIEKAGHEVPGGGSRP